MLRSLSVPAFKTLTGASKFEFFVNPHTSKLFASADNGHNYKVEQAIDKKKEIVVLMDGDDLETACFINKRETLVAQFSL